LAQGDKSSNKSFGLMVMGGGRYDDLRMCVGSPAGIKGGPIADMMFVVQFKKDEKSLLSMNVPIFRPILFGTAFKMLQFEPEVIWEKNVVLKNGKNLIYGPGIGLSFHYGPDYESDLDDRGEDFYAFGPIINYSIGIALDNNQRKKIALKTFYIPLFGENENNGTVIGTSLQYYHIFK
jgi:hypothetical protein